MLHMMKEYGGRVNVNGKDFDSVTDAISELKDYEGKVTIVLNKQKAGSRDSVGYVPAQSVKKRSLMKWLKR